jgi:hypothetical protein
MRRAPGREARRSWRSVLPGRPASRHGPRGSARASRARGSCRQRLGLARSLMVTPWFAAGAGMVIAAAVAVDSPAALTYGPSVPGVRCSVSGCASPAPAREPDLATASPGVALKEPGRAGAARSGPPHGTEAGHGARYQLGYQIIRNRRPGFIAIITMPGDLKPGSWSLQFGFASARIDRVWGALWQPSGNGDAGTALGPWQWRGYAPGEPNADQLTVLATGAPAEPFDCKLNGIICSFG